jgi:hypothetical protein
VATASESAEVTLGAILKEIIATIAPSLRGFTAGQSVLNQLRGCLFEGGDVCVEPWDIVLEDPSGQLLFTCCDHKVDPAVAVAAVPSSADRLNHQLFLVQVAANLRSATDTMAANTGSESAHGGSTRAPQWERTFRMVEQVGLGIGSHTYSGGFVLGTHLVQCFPEGHWQGKRVIELGGGTGMLSIFVALLGAHVTLTDRAEYLDLMRLNVLLNAELIAEASPKLVCKYTRASWANACRRPAIVLLLYLPRSWLHARRSSTCVLTDLC